MATPIRPSNNIFFKVSYTFTTEGLCWLNIPQCLVDIGYSRTEAKRLLKSKSIKIYDTTYNRESWWWYRRPANREELVEPEDVLLVGKKVIIIKATSEGGELWVPPQR